MRLVPLGAVLALVLQSSAAVAILAAGFAASGTLTYFAAVAVVLGGDLGSAILVQVLSVRADWPIPVLLTLGGILFLKTSRRGLKQAGRIILGVAFVLIALKFLREAVQPIGDSAVFLSLADWLQTDPRGILEDKYVKAPVFPHASPAPVPPPEHGLVKS